MAQTFPYGYNGARLTWDQMMRQSTVNRLHPEVRRRFRALIEHAAREGRPLGVGTGWRIQPNPPPPGFARPGNSWHESCPVSPTSSTAMAIDTVQQSSWDWMERNCKTYGLRTFRHVNNEPWHVQPVEIPTGRRFATTLPPLRTWPLPDPPPPSTSGVFVVQGYRQTVKQGSSGKMAKMCQQQMNLLAGQGVVEDGEFGNQSVTALKNVQSALGVTADGICGQQTWQAFENGIKVQAESGGWD